MQIRQKTILLPWPSKRLSDFSIWPAYLYKRPYWHKRQKNRYYPCPPWRRCRKTRPRRRWRSCRFFVLACWPQPCRHSASWDCFRTWYALKWGSKSLHGRIKKHCALHRRVWRQPWRRLYEMWRKHLCNAKRLWQIRYTCGNQKHQQLLCFTKSYWIRNRQTNRNRWRRRRSWSRNKTLGW